eukprot:6182717-Pleurochrysis_carterae.AAC.2
MTAAFDFLCTELISQQSHVASESIDRLCRTDLRSAWQASKNCCLLVAKLSQNSHTPALAE